MGTIKFKMYHSLTHSLTSPDHYDSTVIVTQGFIDHLYVNFDILVIFISLFFWNSNPVPRALSQPRYQYE